MEQKQLNRGELLVIGIGGMGIVTLGDIVARTALRQYKHVAWFPCYTAMMRGGESECCVTFSSEEISSPLIYRSEVVMAMGVQRVEAFEDRVRPGGLMLLEATGIKEGYQPSRESITMRCIPALEAAKQLGDMRNANLVMLAAYIEITKALPSELVLEEIEKRFGGKGRGTKVVAAKEAFMKGMSLVAK